MKKGLGNNNELLCEQFFLGSIDRILYHPTSLHINMGEGKDLVIQEKNFTYKLSDFDAVKTVEVMPSMNYTASNKALYITRVSKSTDLTMTALYGFDGDYPFLILPTNMCGKELEIGDIIAVYPDHYSLRSKQVRLTVSSQYNPKLYLQTVDAEKTKNKQKYNSKLQLIKEKYKNLFLAGKVKEFMYDNILIQKDGTIAFNNVVLEIKDKDILNQFITNLIANRYILNDSFVSSVLTSIKKATVNGIELVFDKKQSEAGDKGVMADRSYINEHRVNNNEAQAALDSVLCYTGNPKGYEDYLSGVSRISLYRQGFIRNGIPFTVDSYSDIFSTSSKELANALKDYELEFNNIDSVAYTCQIPFRKVGNKVPEIFIFDKWRKVDNLEALINFCSRYKTGGRGHSQRLELDDAFFKGLSLHFNQFTATDNQALRYTSNSNIKGFISIMPKLYLISSCLRAEDALFPVTWLRPQAQSSYYGCYRSFAPPTKEVAIEMVNMFETSLGMFKASASDTLKAVVRSKILLEDTVKQHNIKVIKNAAGKIHMFAVQGSSGTIYKVNTAGKVHHEVDGRDEYVCIAYDGSKTIVGFDYAVSVLTALANDKHTADKIHTIQRFIKKS